jgi:flavin reductase (DIM6/NTAB) family NADH-FMN oxidoreductase RutF
MFLFCFIDMGKISRFFVIMTACLPVMSFAQEEEHKYLTGAVPEVEGKIVFTKVFDLTGADRNAIYDRACEWLNRRMEANGNNSRISYTDREEGQLVARGEEYLVFGSSAFSLDRAMMHYHLVVLCEPDKCEMRVERIRYSYEDTRYTAEEQISDEVALNRKKTAVYRGNKKFRVKTVDYVEALFENAGMAFGIREVPPVAPPAASRPQPETVATPVTEPASSTGTPVSLPGYKQISPDKIPGNIIKMLNEDWKLITAGTDAGFNMMTASWGGLGVLYGKPTVTCFINPARYTYQLMETNETCTFTFYTETYREALQYCGSNSGRDKDKVKGSGLTPITTPSGSKAFAEAWLIIECRKLVGQSLSHDALFDEKIKNEWTGKQLHKMYIGEIIRVWVK